MAIAEEDSRIAQVKNFMNEAEYTKALNLISKNLQKPHLSLISKIELYWLQAICFISQENKILAKSAFLKLLALNPTYSPDANLSPKILAVFLDIKDYFAKSGGFDRIYGPKLVPIDDLHSNQNTVVYFSIANLNRLSDISRVVLYLRRQGVSDYSSLDLALDIDKKGSYIAIVPSNLLSSNLDSFAVEYYIEALSNTSSRLTGIGNSQFPLSFLVRAEENKKYSKQITSSSFPLSWPHWVGIGTVVLGAVVLSVVCLSAPQQTGLHITIHR